MYQANDIFYRSFLSFLLIFVLYNYFEILSTYNIGYDLKHHCQNINLFKCTINFNSVFYTFNILKPPYTIIEISDGMWMNKNICKYLRNVCTFFYSNIEVFNLKKKQFLTIIFLSKKHFHKWTRYFWVSKLYSWKTIQFFTYT